MAVERPSILEPKKELDFWLHIMADHGKFIMLGLDCDQTDLKAEAKGFNEKYEKLLSSLGKGESVSSVVTQAAKLTDEFLEFKYKLLRLLVECKIGRNGGSLYPSLINHVSKEARQFLEVLATINKPPRGRKALLEQEVFWTGGMADHAKVIRDYIDPSENKLTTLAQSWSVVFDHLNLQATSLQSMNKAKPESFNAVSQFTERVITDTTGLRDFKLTVKQLLASCKALAITSPEFMDHIAREAQHFLDILQMLKTSNVYEE